MHTAIDLLLGYFVARELGVAHTIFRDFQWCVGRRSEPADHSRTDMVGPICRSRLADNRRSCGSTSACAR